MHPQQNIPQHKISTEN